MFLDKTNELVIAAELRRYCTAHPRAADTLEGVRRFWLQSPAWGVDDVESALGILVAEGLLQERAMADGKTLYVNRSP